MPLTDPRDKKVQRDAFFEWFTGKSYDQVSGSTRSMLQFNFPGKSDRTPIDTRGAARSLGVSQRTVQRWIKGASKPKPETVAKLTTRTRQSVTTKRGRQRLASQTKQSTDRPVRDIRVHGKQGPSADPNAKGTDAARTGNSDLHLSAEEQTALYDAWASGGDEGAVAYLERLYDQPGRYVAGWHLHGVDGIVWKDAV